MTLEDPCKSTCSQKHHACLMPPLSVAGMCCIGAYLLLANIASRFWRALPQLAHVLCVVSCNCVLNQVRGPRYLSDHVKAAAGDCAYSLLAVDLVSTPTAVHHLARFLPSVR